MLSFKGSGKNTRGMRFEGRRDEGISTSEIGRRVSVWQVIPMAYWSLGEVGKIGNLT